MAPAFWTVARIALRRPGLIPALLATAWVFRARGWFRRPPFLPIPPPEYLRWRLETAYGDAHASPTAEELGRYVAWARSLRARR